ncbi:MAG: heme A synthase [Gemmatimonadota bacterium]
MSAHDGDARQTLGRDGAEAPPALRAWRWLSAAAALATFGLIVLGGVVRITGSGMGCGPDWPTCNGQWIPTMDLATFIEWSHRLVAAGVSLLVAGVAAVAWWPGRGDGWRPYRRMAAAAVALLLVQVLLGAVTVRLELPPASVMLHLGTALLLLATLLVGWCRAAGPRRRERTDATALWSWATAGFAFLVVVAGGVVANLDAAAACSGFPLCGGEWWPAGGWRTQVHWGHRLLAYGLVAAVAVATAAASSTLRVRSRRPGDPASRRCTVAAAAVVLLQLGVGAAMVTGAFTTAVRALHVTLGAGAFALLVVAGWTVSRYPASGGPDSPPPRKANR